MLLLNLFTKTSFVNIVLIIYISNEDAREYKFTNSFKSSDIHMDDWNGQNFIQYRQLPVLQYLTNYSLNLWARNIFMWLPYSNNWSLPFLTFK